MAVQRPSATRRRIDRRWVIGLFSSLGLIVLALAWLWINSANLQQDEIAETRNFMVEKAQLAGDALTIRVYSRYTSFYIQDLELVEWQSGQPLDESIDAQHGRKLLAQPVSAALQISAAAVHHSSATLKFKIPVAAAAQAKPGAIRITLSASPDNAHWGDTQTFWSPLGP